LTAVNVYDTVYDMNNTLTRPTFLTPVARRLQLRKACSAELRRLAQKAVR
jgi:hypothetical protein